METLEYFRIVNIFVAVLAMVINLMKGYYLKLHKHMPIDSQIGFMATMAWCLAYSVAGTIAAFHDVETGVWTIIMAAPILWTLIAGLMGWKPLAERDMILYKLGALSPNELRQRKTELDKE